MTDTAPPQFQVGDLSRTILSPPLQSLLTPQIARGLDPELLSRVAGGLTPPTATNPLFSGLPIARPYQPGMAARTFLSGIGSASAPPIDQSYQRNLTALENKYNELEPFMNTLPSHVRQALIDLDTRRVSQGSSPITREATIKAAATAVSNRPATPTPERASGIGGFLSNIRTDLSDILKSIPRVPGALFHEVSELPNIGTRIQEAQDAGMNPLSAMLQAPGIRFIPGAYAASNLLEGNFGELAQHPLFTALDLLPVANRAAAGTRVARGVQAAREAQIATLGTRLGRTLAPPQPRPIGAVLTNRMTPTGPARNILGQTMDRFIQTTPIGQALESGFGSRARLAAREAGLLEQRLKMFATGQGTPRGVSAADEALLQRVAPMFKKWETEYPFLTTKPNLSPKLAAQYRAQRVKFYDDLRTNPDALHPGFVSEYRDLIYAKAQRDYSLGNLGMFDNEMYPTAVAEKLTRAQDRAQASARMVEMQNEYLNPSGQLTVDQLRGFADDIPTLPLRFRMDAARALEQTLDAYGVRIQPLRGKRAALSTNKGDWNAWTREITDTLADPGLVLRPRASWQDIKAILRTQRKDAQVARLDMALLNKNVSQVTRYLDNLYSRKPPTFDPAIYTSLREDIGSLSRRLKFDATRGQRTARLMGRHAKAVDSLLASNAPARFGPTIAREVYGYVDPITGQLTPGRVARDLSVGRTVSPEEAGRFARNIYDKQWQNLPGLDPQFVSDYAATVEREVARTWRDLRAALPDAKQPVFVHSVTPHRAQEGMQGRVGPVPTDETHLAERAIDLTPDAMRDVQVSLTHQMVETLQKAYSEQYIDNIVAILGKTEAELQSYFLSEARATAATDPTLTSRGWLQKLTRDSYRRFNPEEAGFSWGGARFTNYYNENAVYIPTSIYNNLKRYAKQPNIFSTMTDPLTKLFRYNVIGLSPSIIINNFFSNSVAMTAERGLRPWLHFNQAWQWAKNPSARGIPDELRAMMIAEIPHMEHLGMDAYLASRTGQRVMGGVNSAHGFMQSAAADAVRSGKSALDGVVDKSLHLQRLGDNVYRAMIYLDGIERGTLKGMSRSMAEATAMDLVRRTLVDYASFTPIERNAIRSIIPFYSYMGHAARFIMRYPLNHPMRAMIVSKIADSERERLGALPGSFLSFFPLGSIDSMGKMNMFNLRPFDPFGDQADLLTISGWVAAMNPAAQIALRQIGVTRGEAEIYPTLRYDPETGRMKAVRPNPLTDLLMTAVPRAGLLTSLAGLNPDYNELRARDQAAADRSLLAQAGIPRLWREINVPQEQIRAELSRQQVETDVLNQALRSGDWTEALRYPNLRAYYAQVGRLNPEELASMTPATPEALSEVVSQDILGG